MQDSTKFSLFYLVYGRQACLPVQFNMKALEGESDSEDSGGDVANGAQNPDLKTHTEMITLRKKALHDIGVAQERQKG